VSAAKPRTAFALVTAAVHRRLGLLKGWRFYRVAPGTDLRCTLCGRPAAYATVPDRMPKCERHAKDF
jgi:hypothetical protein